jgi:hypothetical protein
MSKHEAPSEAVQAAALTKFRSIKGSISAALTGAAEMAIRPLAAQIRDAGPARGFTIKVNKGFKLPAAV